MRARRASWTVEWLALAALFFGCGDQARSQLGQSPLDKSGSTSSTSTGSGQPIGECKQQGKRGFVNVVKAQTNLPTNTGPCIVYDDLDGDGVPELILNAIVWQKTSQLIVYKRVGAQWTAVKTLLDYNGSKPFTCVAGDVDNDGLTDLVVAQAYSGERRLFRNVSPGAGEVAFEQVPNAVPTQTLGEPPTPDGLFDYDNDGRLDYLISRFVDSGKIDGLSCITTETDFFCPSKSVMQTAEALLFRNVGNGSFELNSSAAFSTPWGSATNASAFVDWNDDGKIDVLLANDWDKNQIYLNGGGGKFTNVAETEGFALGNHGMGLAIEDFDGDGKRDIYVADLGPNQLFMGGAGALVNRAQEFGVVSATRYMSNWAPIAEDFDNDGDLDIYVVAAAVGSNEEDMNRIALGGPLVEPGPQHDLIFWNEGKTFLPEVVPHGTVTNNVIFGVSATADFDGDGDMDVIAMSGFPPELRVLVNQSDTGNYLNVELVSSPARTVSGTRLTLMVGDKQLAEREYHVTRGSLGNSQRIVHFGLCDRESVDAIEIRWPDGRTERKEGPILANQTLKLTVPK